MCTSSKQKNPGTKTSEFQEALKDKVKLTCKSNLSTGKGIASLRMSGIWGSKKWESGELSTWDHMVRKRACWHENSVQLKGNKNRRAD